MSIYGLIKLRGLNSQNGCRHGLDSIFINYKNYVLLLTEAKCECKISLKNAGLFMPNKNCETSIVDEK